MRNCPSSLSPSTPPSSRSSPRPARPQGRSIRRDLATGLVEQVFDWDLGGTQRLVDIDLETLDDTSHTVYSIREGDPLSAAVASTPCPAWPGARWRTMRPEVDGTMTLATPRGSSTSGRRSTAYEGDRRVFARARGRSASPATTSERRCATAQGTR